jgi:hypothetical protein
MRILVWVLSALCALTAARAADGPQKPLGDACDA